MDTLVEFLFIIVLIYYWIDFIYFLEVSFQNFPIWLLGRFHQKNAAIDGMCPGSPTASPTVGITLSMSARCKGPWASVIAWLKSKWREQSMAESLRREGSRGESQGSECPGRVSTWDNLLSFTSRPVDCGVAQAAPCSLALDAFSLTEASQPPPNTQPHCLELKEL